MEQNQFRKNALDMIYLTVCAVTGKTPERARVETLDPASLFTVCQKHVLTACVAYALESAGINDHNFTQAKEKAIRKNILLDAERRSILSRFEKEQIWYMPLKGALLKDWYPKLGMRQMSDNDILFDPAYRSQVREIMKSRGFQLKNARRNVDEYEKEPVYNFEMHASLFPEQYGIGHEMAAYYRDVRARLIRDDAHPFGYHFSDEDFYLYMLAHEYKHFSDGGTGVRSLVDTYVFLHRFGSKMNRAYIRAELEKLHMTDYEKQNRVLAMKLFSGDALTEQEQALLDYHIFSGTYGTIQNKYDRKIRRSAGGSKKSYIISRIFPPMNYYKMRFPWAYRCKILIPAAWLYRVFSGLLFRREKLSEELHYLNRKK